MAFEYSCFISYRRETQRNIFIENFCTHLKSFAFDASGIRTASAYWNSDLTGNIEYRLGKYNTSLSVFYKYSGRAPQVVPNDDRTISVGWVSEFHTLDITCMKSFLRNHFSISAGEKNLFNVKTVAAVGAQGGAHSSGTDSANIAWGRTFFVKLAYNFNKYK